MGNVKQLVQEYLEENNLTELPEGITLDELVAEVEGDYPNSVSGRHSWAELPSIEDMLTTEEEKKAKELAAKIVEDYGETLKRLADE